MLHDKAMIIIAVSKYAGAYDNLPGAVTSAQRLRRWAEQQDKDCNYKVLYLADDVFEEIDVQLVREKVRNFVSQNVIDRLVVYFAGHGIVRSAGDQFWLLTNAANDLREGINVEAFRRGLLKCNFGTHNDELPAGQLCIISDACRNTSRDAIDFSGDPILTSTARMNKCIQLDRFLSTGLGDYSFQIDEADGSGAYCLFSEVLLNALCGEVQEAIETDYHKFKPVVTNHKLAEYLEREVRKRAAAIEEEMQPDLLTGIRPPYNFYKRLRKPLAAPNVMPSSQDPQLAAAVQMAIHKEGKKGSDHQLSTDQEHRRQILLEARQYIERAFEESQREENYPYNRLRTDSSDFPIICDFLPNCIAAPRSAIVQVRPRERFYEIISSNFKGAPILINQGKQWILAPHYPNVVPIVLCDLPGDILLYKPYVSHEWYEEDESWDTYLSDFSNLVRSAPLRAADANKFADKIRVGKEKYPHQSVTAGYLYEFSNDYDNIARTAHYMANNTKLVPFDLALLCADKIWRRKENGRFVAFADLPAVEHSQAIENEGNRPYYAWCGFQARKKVRLWGIAPIFSQGWNFMQTELYLKIPKLIRRIAEETSGRSIASLTKEGLEMFLEAFDYRVIETDRLSTTN
jgi:hypothetical protein